ncbi:MAG TPA: ABC transporter permease subunit [Candidatus Saccharimonadales bacterium]|nr:ABC transporter permease subunit [Candidatus Saccharimonadales bacterium]
MFRSIFLKTLHEKRLMMIFWSIGVIAMSMLMMGFYHSFSGGGFDELLKNLPKSVQGLVGNIADLKTVGGYVSQEVFALRIPLLTLIMGIVLFVSLLSGDEDQGTLQTLLAQPVSRTKVYFEKYIAGLVVSLIICSMAIIGVEIGLVLIHEQMSLIRLVQAVLDVWLLTVLFGTLGFSIGAINGKRGFAGSLAGIIAFSTYILTSFVANVQSLVTIEKLSPFHYYNKPAAALSGLKGENVMIMIGVTVVFLIVGWVVFAKRDIYQR